MITLLKILPEKWEQAKGYLRLDLEAIEAAMNQRWSATFGASNLLNPDTIQGWVATQTRYISNEATSPAAGWPMWAQVNLANGVKNRLPFSNFVSATAGSKLVGRGAGAAGDFEEISLGAGLVMAATTLSVDVGSLAGRIPIPDEPYPDDPWPLFPPSSQSLTLPLVVAEGGSGRATATAYAVICGGTTATAPHQSIADVGTSGQVLTSNGAGALPTFQNASGGGGWTLIEARAASGTEEDFVGLTYDEILIIVRAVTSASNTILQVRVSTDNGSTFLSSSGDYIAIAFDDPVGGNKTEMPMHNAATTSGKNGMFSLTMLQQASPKMAWAQQYVGAGAAAQGVWILPGTTVIDAIRVLSSTGASLNGGTIYVFGR